MFSDFSDNNRGDEDFFEEARQKLNNEPMVNFEERKNEINRSKNVFIGTVSGIALAAVVGWFVLSPRYKTGADAEIPVIRRPQAAVKVQPVEPGGMEILNQDKSVYDIIEKKDNTPPAVENLLPPPEEPKLPAIAPAEEQNVKIVDVTEQIKSSDKTVAQAQEIIKVAEAPKVVPAPEAKEAPVKPLSQAAQPSPAPKAEPAPVPAPAPAAAAAPAPKKDEPIKVVVKIPETAPQSAVAGSWQVQLISSANRSAVEKSWTDLSKKYTVLQGLPHEIEEADLGAKGTFYRLKAGAFADRGGADKLCGDIKALGGSCLVKQK